MFRVTIEGNDIIPMARILDALTRAGLLDSAITWSERGNALTVNVDGTPAMMSVFQVARFKCRVIDSLSAPITTTDEPDIDIEAILGSCMSKDKLTQQDCDDLNAALRVVSVHRGKEFREVAAIIKGQLKKEMVR